MLDSLRQDLRYAFRHVLGSPGFAIAAVLTLALAIGATSAMFSLVHALLLRELPVKDPGGLIAVSGVDAQGMRQLTPIPALDLLSDGPLQELCAYNAGGLFSIEVNGSPTQAVVGLVSGGCFDTFGVPPMAGRMIADEDSPLHGRGNFVVVIGHGLWKRMFNGDPAAIGKTLKVEGSELRIIGVMPEGFVGLHAHSPIDFFTPYDTWSPARADRRPGASHIVGRLKPGVTFAQASRQLETQWPAVLDYAVPATMAGPQRAAMVSVRARVEHFGTGFSVYRDFYSQPVKLMFGLTAVLLLLACLNLGGLLMSRTIARGTETAVRLALGSSRWRIARQLLMENLLLSTGGAALAVPVSFAFVNVVIAFLPVGIDHTETRLTPDPYVIGVTAGIGVVAGIVMSVLPMWLSAPSHSFSGLGAARSVSRATNYWGRGVLVAQVALSLVMVAGAGLLGRSLYLLGQVETGLRTEHVTVARLRPLPNAYATLNNAAYYPPLLDRIAALPGVTSVGSARIFPRMTLVFGGSPIAFVGDAPGDARAISEIVWPGFFETVGIPLLGGRAISWTDTAATRQVAVVSERLAQSLASDGQVIGRRVTFGIDRENQDVEIVGVVANASMGNARHPDLPMLFRPAAQLPPVAGRHPSIVIRHEPAAAQSVIDGVRKIASEGGREFLLDAMPLQSVLERAPASERMSAVVATALAGLAIVLAFVGVFGLLAYSVARRTREIGVRTAIGADATAVTWMVVREGLWLTAAGVVVGVPAAYAGARLLSSLTFGVSQGDPLTFASTAIFFIVLGVVAGLVPARRAARVDPVIALRAE